MSQEEESSLTTDDDNEVGEALSPVLMSPEKYEFINGVRTIEEITEHMLDTIKEVNTVVQLPPTITRILLNHCKWDKASLYQRYFEDQEKLFRDAHIVNPNTVKKVAINMDSNIECDICNNELPAKDMISIACSHPFCRKCWIQYLTTKIMDQGLGVTTISCARPGCDILVDDETVLKLITDSAVISRFKRQIITIFVECNQHFCLCPKGCDYVISVDDIHPDEPMFVKCFCYHVFCFSCGQIWHFPLTCELLKKWSKKCSDDIESVKWISANTKDCPKCKMAIQKDGGCNRILCAQPSCKFEFCWLCMNDWEDHAYIACNRYKDELEDTKTDNERANTELHRFIFYANRYKHHMESYKLENQLYNRIKDKMEKLRPENPRENLNYPHVDFLEIAVDVLVSCRRMLMHSYAFVYYLKENHQLHIFEENQKDLEAATEELSKYLERDIDSDILTSVKQKVQDMRFYCRNRRQALVSHINEGYEKGWWKYLEDKEGSSKEGSPKDGSPKTGCLKGLNIFKKK